MKIAIIKDNNITIGTLIEMFPNVSFPAYGVEPQFLQENSAVKVVEDIPNVDDTKKLIQTAPYLRDSKVYLVDLVDKTPEELAEEAQVRLSSAAILTRNQRNQLLKDSDWTQVADAPVDKTAWATYRQALRDVTTQEGFPFNVVFPTPPL